LSDTTLNPTTEAPSVPLLPLGDLIPYALLAAIIAILAQLPPNNDVAWQLWIGRQLAGGAVLYRDIVEINPPLWFWLAVPIVQAANLLGISGTAAVVGFLGVAAALSVALLQRLVGRGAEPANDAVTAEHGSEKLLLYRSTLAVSADDRCEPTRCTLDPDDKRSVATGLYAKSRCAERRRERRSGSAQSLECGTRLRWKQKPRRAG
jgi:hypothetical protein